MSVALFLLLCVPLAFYVTLVRRYDRKHARAFNRQHVAAFTAALASIYFALAAPLERLADASFLYHMTQHMMLVYVAAPLLLLSAPVKLLLGAIGRSEARQTARFLRSPLWRAVTFPVFTWIFFTAVMWVTHLSGLYEVALERPGFHIFEHALYFGSALLFWQAIIHVGPVAWPMNFPLRIMYVFLAMPQSAFLGLALYQTAHVLYPHYVAAQGSMSAALADQHNGGALMWIAGGLLLFIAFMLVAAMWGYHVRRLGQRLGGALVGVVTLTLLATSQAARADSNLTAGGYLFAIHCSACHGAQLQGSPNAPSLRTESRAGMDFWLSTGRMPASLPYTEDMHVTSIFSRQQITQLTQFVMSRSHGSNSLPSVGTDGNLPHGRELFMANCAACHGATAAGGAVGYGWIAPPLDRASNLQVAEAVRIGPGVMPSFNAQTLSDRDINDIARYLDDLKNDSKHYGGVSSGGLGPVAEGAVAWLVGMGLLFLTVRAIGSNA